MKNFHEKPLDCCDPVADDALVWCLPSRYDRGLIELILRISHVLLFSG